jgi:YidC/Oxa1 family membrane protein insertase
MDDQSRNLILATALSFLVLLGWFVLGPILFPSAFPTPEEAQPAPRTAAEAPAVPGAAPAPTAEGVAALPEAREAVLAKAPRLPIRTDRVAGSLSLAGARIDDLSLRDYTVTVEPDSPTVTLLQPPGVEHAYYARYGWTPWAPLTAADVPAPDTLWTVEEGDALTEATPVTLRWDNGRGLTFRQTFAIDENYMFTVTQSVENATGEEVTLSPYGILVRQGMPPDLKNFYILHEGFLAMNGSPGVRDQLNQFKYKAAMDFDQDPGEAGPAWSMDVAENGWIGFTDHYWMSVLIPEPGQPFTGVARYNPASDTFLSDMRLPDTAVAPGATAASVTSLFAGAKEWATIRAYQNQNGVFRFVDSIDWGWFFFLTKPIFIVLHEMNKLIGNMGLAIIGLTFVIKLILFPLAYKSYVSMSRMKALQPQMEKIKETAGDDRMKMQQEVMALYKREKVNPAAGCLPILLQIPIFFSLYKVIFVTIELRHAPFFGWIRDLSAPDPTSWMNLFGLLPWGAPDHTSFLGILSIGVWPIVLGVSMWLQQKLNPAPADKTQAMIFNWMPWIFMFMLGSFASGLVIYWVANNTITFIQQYTIMRSQGVKPNVLGNMFGPLKKSSKTG